MQIGWTMWRDQTCPSCGERLAGNFLLMSRVGLIFDKNEARRKPLLTTEQCVCGYWLTVRGRREGTKIEVTVD